jgi:hypothetical protein
LEKSSGVSNGKKPTLKGSSTQSEISIPAFPPVPEQLFMENSNLSTEQIQAFIVALHKHYSALIGLVNKLNTDKVCFIRSLYI